MHQEILVDGCFIDPLQDQAARNEALLVLYAHAEQIVRRKLRASFLRYHLEPEDICQAIFCDLLREVSKGKVRLSHPARGAKFIEDLVRHYLVNAVRRLRASRRDVRRTESESADTLSLESHEGDLREHLALDELSQNLQADFTASEREIWGLWQMKKGSQEIALATGNKPDASRKCMARIRARYQAELAK